MLLAAVAYCCNKIITFVLHCVVCRYKKAADWQLISDIVAASSLPIIGNGDILTHYEAADR
jgi:tRNA-dihydrouridine synthase